MATIAKTWLKNRPWRHLEFQELPNGDKVASTGFL